MILVIVIHAWIVIKYTVTTIIIVRTEAITIQIFNSYGTSEAPLHYFPMWDCQILSLRQLFDHPRPRRKEDLSVKTLIDAKIQLLYLL